MSDMAGFGAVMSGISTIGNLGLGIATNVQNQKNQQEAWRREDTAVKRRVADLESAGINKVLAAGQGAQSSGPIKLTQPEVKGNAFQDYIAIKSAQQNIAQSQASVELTKAQAEKTRSEARFLETTFDNRSDKIFYDMRNKNYQSAIKGLDLEIQKQKMDILKMPVSAFNEFMAHDPKEWTNLDVGQRRELLNQAYSDVELKIKNQLKEEMGYRISQAEIEAKTKQILLNLNNMDFKYIMKSGISPELWNRIQGGIRSITGVAGTVSKF